ncbi:acetyl-CoA carboxylase biotin carboxylase subunit family protein, partial [Streptomyces sp. NPDC059371]|uniref:ATP-grasp domain-containing protein n=1 Tax=Streptomyces sp. NPDC059371 TaxID=3346812 RepID=UPI0036B7EB7D
SVQGLGWPRVQTSNLLAAAPPETPPARARDARARELARRYGVGQIVACQERDLERAAGLRRHLALPGPRPDEVEPFRDKWTMKRRARRAGIPVAEHALVTSPARLRAFARRHGLPVVVKPRRGAGSAGLRILADDRQVDAFAASGACAHREPAWLAESFVPGAMCHIDGLVTGGRIRSIWAFQYLYTLAAFREDHKARLDLPLDPDDPLAHRLIDFGRGTLRALRGPEHFAFHIEVFRTPRDDLVLCEAACRAPGAALRDVHRAMFGFDPAEAAVRAQLGLPPPLPLTADTPEDAPLRPRVLAGQMLLMKRPGTVRGLPGGLDTAPGLFWHRTYVQVGRRMTAPTYSADVLAAFVVSGPTRADCERRMHDLDLRYRAGLEIDSEEERREQSAS